MPNIKCHAESNPECNPTGRVQKGVILNAVPTLMSVLSVFLYGPDLDLDLSLTILKSLPFVGV